MPQSPAKKRKTKWGWTIVRRFNEHELQIHIATLIHAWALSRPYVWWTGIDHAARLSPRYGRDRKMRGIKPGIPDFYILARGKSVWLEAKSETGKVMPSQQKVHEQIHASNGYVFVVRRLDDVWEVLNWIDREDWQNPPVLKKECNPAFAAARDRLLAERRAARAAQKAGLGSKTEGGSGGGV